MKDNTVENPLTVPQGYFEQSYQTTMTMARRVRRRRAAVLGSCLAAAALLGAALTWNSISYNMAQEDFLAQQQELLELDVFMQIN